MESLGGVRRDRERLPSAPLLWLRWSGGACLSVYGVGVGALLGVAVLEGVREYVASTASISSSPR